MVSQYYSQFSGYNPGFASRPAMAGDTVPGLFPKVGGFSAPLPPFQGMPMPTDRLTLGATTDVHTANSADPTIQRALDLLGKIQNRPQDEAYMQRLGIQVIFRNGRDALNLIRAKGIRVEFGDMGDSLAHAQWLADEKRIMINRRYQGDTSPATLYAISEAIYHEAGHAAKLAQNPITGLNNNLSFSSANPNAVGDDMSSIQEELNCLALNTLAHRYHASLDPTYAHAASNSRLLSDGVALYARLFFDPDMTKQALINRVVEKYGDLPLCSPGHEQASSLACLVAQKAAQQAALRQDAPHTLGQAASPFVLPTH